MSSAIAWSGSSTAMLVTKSKEPSASAEARAVSTMERALERSAASSERTARGVKPRWTIWRTRVCSGGSMLSMMSFWTSIWSRLIVSLKRMTAVLVFEENNSGCVETYLTSAWRVTAQYPESPKPEMLVGWVHHQTGAVCRIRANSGCGTRACRRSGSVKSNPSGRWGQRMGTSPLRA
ncbi:hypothetical protein SMICM17S_05424 [Streptomyces microflavus]